MFKENAGQKLTRILLPILVLGAGVAAGAVVYTSKPPIEETPPEIKPRAVNTIAVEASSVSVYVESQGTVEARQIVSIIPQVSGQITRVSDKFVNGGVFEEGELLLQIDPRDYEVAVTSAEAVVADAHQQLETVKAQAEQAVSEWTLLDRGTPTALALRKPQLEGAEARLKSAEAELQKAQLMLERTRLVAPFTGIITGKLVDRGQYVTAGTQLAELSSSGIMEIRLSLPEREIGKIDLEKLENTGLRVNLEAVSGEFGKVWHGQVVRTEGKIDPKTRNTVAVARLSGPDLIADDGHTRITIGQFVRARIEGRDFSKVFELPRVALHNGDSVYVVDHENRLRERKVTVLNASDESILVAEGISDGDVITVSPMTSGVEGIQVVSLDHGEG